MVFSASDSSLSSINPTIQSGSEQFLRFRLGEDTAAIVPIAQLTEVLSIPLGGIIPIPHLPGWVMGVFNWRGEILWTVDLGHLVGLTPWHQQAISSYSNHKAIVLHGHSRTQIRAKNQMLGLVVSQVEGIEWCNPDEIQSPPSSAIAPELVPFLRGYWVKSDGEILVALDGEAIIAAMPSS